jgi:hypothetical protein
MKNDVEDDSSHYVLLRDLAGFMRHPKQFYQKLICRNCLQGFTSEHTLNDHAKYCLEFDKQKTRFPKGDTLSFHRWDRTQPVPFRFYADFEAILPTSTDKIGKKTKAKVLQKHLPNGYSWKCIDFNGNLIANVVYRTEDPDENVAVRFIKEIVQKCGELEEVLKEYQAEAYQNMVIDPDLMEKSVQENKCCFCKKQLNECDDDENNTVKHHSHLPPYNFIGLAHNECNLVAKMKIQFPVTMHNFGSYDVHFIVLALGELTKQRIIDNIKVIPKTAEKFLALILNKKIKLLDSMTFTQCSLENVVKTMKDDGLDFPITRQAFNNHPQVDLLFQKSAYPYSYMTSLDKFKEDK